MRAIRWGVSAYETDQELSRQREQLARVGIHMEICEELPRRLWTAEILLVHSKKQVTEEVLALGRGLRLVLTTTSGVEHIDLRAARTFGVQVGRCPMARREPVVQTSVAMGLSLMRGLPVLQSRAERGAWARGELSVLGMRSVEGMRVGLIGAGVIGSRVAEVWRALGADVWISDPAHPEHRPWERVAEACDLISLHCSLTPETRGLVDSSFLESMRSGAVLVNTARGELLDIDALLASEQLGGAGLDVFSTEPLPPFQLQALTQWGAWVTPHAAGYHEGLSQSLGREVVDSLSRWRRGMGLPSPVSLPY